MGRLIAIHGKKRSGKGTIANYLTNKHNYQHVVISRPLKDMTNIILEKVIDFNKTKANLIDFTDGDLKEYPLKALNGYSTRDIMIWIGTQFSFSINPDLWIDITMTEIDHHLKNNKNVYVDNLRLYPEFNILKEKGAELWAVVSSHHYNELPTVNNYNVYENQIKPFDVINDIQCSKMIKYIFDRLLLDKTQSINNHSYEECTNILKNILRNGISGNYDNQPPLSEKGLDLNYFTIIKNDGSIHDLENKIENFLSIDNYPKIM